MSNKLMTMIEFLDPYIFEDGNLYYFEISADIRGFYGSRAQARSALLFMIIEHLDRI